MKTETPPPGGKEGSWTPRDDLQLKEAVVTIGDFDMIQRLVTFSQNFSSADIEKRWTQLLYDPVTAETSSAQMAVLPMANKRITDNDAFLFLPQNIFIPQTNPILKKHREDPLKKLTTENKEKKSLHRHISPSLMSFLEKETMNILLDEKVRSQVNDKVVELPDCPDDLKTQWIKEQEKKTGQEQHQQQTNQSSTGERAIKKESLTTGTKDHISKTDKQKEHDLLKRSTNTNTHIKKTMF